MGDQILREISCLFVEDVRDPRLSGVTLTGVNLSDDLKEAKVYYSVYGEESRIPLAQEGLDRAKGFMKRAIGLRMKLRYVPGITFIHDPSMRKASRLEEIFEDIKKKQISGPGEAQEGDKGGRHPTGG